MDTFTQIREMIAKVGKEHGADIMVAYPDVVNEKDLAKSAIPQSKLQTPAMTPYYLNPELDLTSEVIARLNKKYPIEKPKTDD